MNWLFRAALRLVPASWRDAVRGDLEEEVDRRSLAGSRADIWRISHVLRLAVRLRLAITWHALLFDLRHALRSLVRAKGFTLAAVLTLVLGIGANLATFTVVDRALFRPLPFADVDRLVMVKPYDPSTGATFSSFSKLLFVEGRRGLDAIHDMAYFGFTSSYPVEGEAEAPGLALTSATYNALDVLGITPMVGRGFTREDAEAKLPVAVISFEAWRSRFGGRVAVLGRLIGARTPARVVGVLPRGVIVPSVNRSMRWDGLILEPDLMEAASPQERVDPAVARLRPGRSIRATQEQFDALAVRLEPELRAPDAERGPRVLVEPLRVGMFWFAWRYLWLLAAAASIVGLLACVNFSALLLARGRSREQELALRASIGASTSRLMAAEFIQGLLICAMAAAACLLVFHWTAESLRALVPAYYRPLVLNAIDGRVLGFTVLATVLASVFSSALPAWRASRTTIMGVIQRGAGAPLRARAGGGRSALAVEAAAGVMLVAAAAVVVRSFVGLAFANVGFTPAGLQVLRVALRSGAHDPAELARYLRMLEVLRQQPGISNAGGVDSMPAAGAAPMTGIRLGPRDSVGLWQITDGFFATVGSRLLAGRDITPADMDRNENVALVTRSAAQKFWPDAHPESVTERTISDVRGRTWRVIGVLADVRDRPDEAPMPKVFAAARPLDFFGFLEFAVRSTGSGPDLRRLQAALRDCCDVASISMVPAGARIANALEQPRVQALMFGAFAIIGLLLVGLGLFAVVSFEIALRRYEMGIRLALGATARGIERLVMLQALRPVLLGAGVGLILAFWTGQFLQSLVYGVDARDPGTLALVIVVMTASALLAAWVPARRAAATDPAVVLRAQ